MIYHSPACLEHQPTHEFDGKTTRKYPESPDRIDAILKVVESNLWQVKTPNTYNRDHITKVHQDNYVSFIENIPDNIETVAPTVFNTSGEIRHDSSFYAKLGQYFFDPATPITPGTTKAAKAAVDCSLAVVDELVSGSSRSAALCRPPGHHAMKHQGGGYCIFNNVAIAAQYLRDKNKSVSILDLDYHHGNGTQELFYDRGDVQYVSVHADTRTNYPFYWGFEDQSGVDDGKGMTTNLPVSNFISPEQYLEMVDTAITQVQEIDPDILLVSMGFDCYIDDPIAGLSLGIDHYREIGKKLHPFSKVGVILEGGYAVEAIGQCFGNLYQEMKE